MASVLDMDVASVIEHRGAALIMAGQSGLGKYKVQLCQKLHVHAKLLCTGRCLVAQGGQNRFDFLLLLYFQLTHLIVQLDDGHWLDEKGGACGGLVMDHAGYLVFVL